MNIKALYFALKRYWMRTLCLAGRHDYKLSVYDKSGRKGACLWCRSSIKELGTK